MILKKTFFAALCIAGTLSSASAQNESEQFKDVDLLLESIKKSAESIRGLPGDLNAGSTSTKTQNKPVVSVSTADIKAKFNETTIKSEDKGNPADVGEQSIDLKDSDANHANAMTNNENKDLNVRFTEMPPYTTFTFNRKVFIPAYKDGVVLQKGEATYNLDDREQLGGILASLESTEGACAILSNKSYVMMTPKSSSSQGTSLTVNRVEIKSINEGKEYLSLIHFDDKSDKQGKNKVSISLACVIPANVKNNLYEYRLKHLDASLNGLFTIDMPNFIEL